jgi:hypothetical protein
MEIYAEYAAEELVEAWKRPVRHNRSIELATLWHALCISQDCDRILDAAGTPDIGGPATDALTRYDIEAAIRTIPETLPFARRERETLNRSLDSRNIRFQHGIGGMALRQLALVERWHEWLWIPPHEPSDRRASPNPEAEVLHAGYIRLANGLRGIQWPASAPNQ